MSEESPRIQPNPPNAVRGTDIPSESPGLIDHLTTPVLMLEAGSVIERMNSAAETLLDTSMQAARGLRLSELVTGCELLEAIDRVLDTGVPLTERDLSITLSTNRPRIVDCTLTPIVAAHGAPEDPGRTGAARPSPPDHPRGAAAHADRLCTEPGAPARPRDQESARRAARRAQLLESELPNAALREYTGVIIREADRLTNLVDRMLGPRRPRAWSR